jgi:hypothetical protein
MACKSQSAGREAFSRNHDSNVGPKVFGLLGEGFDIPGALSSTVVLAFDNTEAIPSGESPSNYHVILTDIAHPVG